MFFDCRNIKACFTRKIGTFILHHYREFNCFSINMLVHFFFISIKLYLNMMFRSL